VAAARPIDVAELFRDQPRLALLEAARPGRRSRWSYLTADPVAIVEVGSVAAAVDRAPRGPSPADLGFDEARRLLRRLDGARPARAPEGAPLPPFAGGLVGYLGYDAGLLLEPRGTIAVDDQGLPIVRLALHDWIVAWDRRSGAAWLAGRALDGDRARLAHRLGAVRERLSGMTAERAGEVTAGRADEGVSGDLPFRSNLDRTGFEGRVEAIRAAIAAGEIYQANLSRRLETPFRGDPWSLYRRVRTGDPALFAAFLDLGPSPAGAPRAIVSASPEPFLAVDADGRVLADPIKGTRPRGRDRMEDRALARELLGSEKDRAENTMIVDVLRNDLGRVCTPGSVRVSRLCRLERTATVQHLVSTVSGHLAAGRDPFDLLAASFPGGSISGAPKLRAMRILEELETVRRGPYTGALGWIGPDGAMATSILIRTFVADGGRLSLNVGGGITWRSDPRAEWEETRAKAAGPLGAIGGHEVDG
ncbi:MAG: anthranilate synthase component I family protein, partial [Candidatus Limnocylindrales bacterium]